MNKLLSILFALACIASVQASDVIRATIIIDTPANLNGTNAASLTVNADTRIATNSVVSASTQWKASTNASMAAFNLLNHLRSFGFSGVQLQATNNGVVLIGSEGGALAITISNSWATVAKRTNSAASTGTVATEERANAFSGNNTFSGTQTFSGANTFSGLLTLKNFTANHSALAVDNAATNFVADFTGDEYRSVTATNSINLLQSTNRGAARSVVLFLYPNGTNRSLTVPATWHALASADAVITNTTVGILSLTVNGTSETNVFYSYKAVP